MVFVPSGGQKLYDGYDTAEAAVPVIESYHLSRRGTMGTQIDYHIMMAIKEVVIENTYRKAFDRSDGR